MQLAETLLDGARRLQRRYFSRHVAERGRGPRTGAERRSPLGTSPTAAALVYAACRHAAVPRTFKECARYSGLTPKAIFRRLSKMRTVLCQGGSAGTLPRVRAEEYLGRYCAGLELGFAVEKESRAVLRATEAEQPIASGAAAAAAAAILVALRHPTPQQIRALSQVSCLALPTVKRNFKAMWFAWALSPTSTV